MSYTCWVEYHEACPGGACTCTCHSAGSDKVRHEVDLENLEPTHKPGGSELWRLIGDAFGRAAAADSPRPPDPEICPHPIRVDGPGHSWTWDGDDPRIECAGCKELRDAHNGHVIRTGQA